MVKGAAMFLFGAAVLVQAAFKILSQGVPDAEAMGVIGVLALAANGTCLALLLRHRADDINMKSAWICSRNDIAANVAVIAAGALFALTGSVWPDVAIGLGISALFIKSAVGVFREATATLLREARGERH